MGVGSSSDAKFAKLMSVKGRDFVHGGKLGTGSLVHFYRPRRCSRPIWCSFDEWVLAYCLPNRPSRFDHQTLQSQLRRASALKMGATQLLLERTPDSFRRVAQFCNLPWRIGITDLIINNRFDKRHWIFNVLKFCYFLIIWNPLCYKIGAFLWFVLKS